MFGVEHWFGEGQVLDMDLVSRLRALNLLLRIWCLSYGGLSQICTYTYLFYWSRDPRLVGWHDFIAILILVVNTNLLFFLYVWNKVSEILKLGIPRGLESSSKAPVEEYSSKASVESKLVRKPVPSFGSKS